MKNNFTIEVCFGDYPKQAYEWDNKTILTHMKVERTSTSFLKSVLLYDGIVKDRKGLMLISDCKSACVLKLSDKGKILKRSFLEYDKSLDVCEYACNLKVEQVEFENNGKKIDYPKYLAVENEIKEYILDKLYKTHNEDLSRYMYFLYFGKLDEYSKEKLIKTISTGSIDDNLKLYNFLIES